MAPPQRRTDVDVRVAATAARWLDDYYLDPVLGFVLPGVGDALGSMLGLITVAVAVRRRLPPVLIARMLLNLAVDGLVGAIPLVGDVLDVFGRANVRNAALLAARPTGSRARPVDWLILAGAGVAFAAALAAPIVFAVWAVIWAIGRA